MSYTIKNYNDNVIIINNCIPNYEFEGVINKKYIVSGICACDNCDDSMCTKFTAQKI